VTEEDKYAEERVLYSPDGFIYSLTFLPEEDSRPPLISLGSFSDCFIPSSDFDPHLHY